MYVIVCTYIYSTYVDKIYNYLLLLFAVCTKFPLNCYCGNSPQLKDVDSAAFPVENFVFLASWLSLKYC